MNLDSIHLQKINDPLRLALLQADDSDSLCAILLLDLPEMPDPPVPGGFSNRVEWRKSLIAQKKVWVKQQIGETLRQLDDLGLDPRGGFLGQVVVHGPATHIRSALELDRVTQAILDHEMPFPNSSLPGGQAKSVDSSTQEPPVNAFCPQGEADRPRIKQHQQGKSIREEAAETLETAQRTVGASSCVFYVRDPLWPDVFRLLFMPGVEKAEFMEGFSKQVFDREERREIYCGPMSGVDEFRDTPLGQMGEDRQNLARANPVFQGFVAREGIASFARILLSDSEGVQAALFINYSTPQTFDESQKSLLRELAARVKGFLPRLLGDLGKQPTAVPFDKVARIAQPVERLIRDLKTLPALFPQSLRDILVATCRAFEMRPNDSIGIIQLFEPEAGTLHPVAWVSELPATPTELSVAKGAGIVSLVALRRCSVRVRDLNASPLKRVFHELIGESRSVLAVPILAGQELLGTLCLDSRIPNHFSEKPIGVLWHAANQIALACRFAEQTSLQRATKFKDGVFQIRGWDHSRREESQRHLVELCE